MSSKTLGGPGVTSRTKTVAPPSTGARPFFKHRGGGGSDRHSPCGHRRTPTQRGRRYPWRRGPRNLPQKDQYENIKHFTKILTERTGGRGGRIYVHKLRVQYGAGGPMTRATIDARIGTHGSTERNEALIDRMPHISIFSEISLKFHSPFFALCMKCMRVFDRNVVFFRGCLVAGVLFPLTVTFLHF